jgi:hypothetical protein
MIILISAMTMLAVLAFVPRAARAFTFAAQAHRCNEPNIAGKRLLAPSHQMGGIAPCLPRDPASKVLMFAANGPLYNDPGGPPREPWLAGRDGDVWECIARRSEGLGRRVCSLSKSKGSVPFSSREKGSVPFSQPSYAWDCNMPSPRLAFKRAGAGPMARKGMP